jgi:hypothetical protein
MAALGSQSIASSFEQLLHVDADGGGNGTTHVSVKDGDNGTTFGFTIATDALMMTGTNRLEFGDNGTYIHQSADGVLDLVSDTELELNATTIDINGAVDISGDTASAGNLTLTKGDASNTLIFNANLSSAADNIAFLKGNWNNTTVSQITLFTGPSTSPKDDGGIAFATKTTTQSLAERMRIDTVGNIGIGDTDPSEAKLSIDNVQSGDVGIKINQTQSEASIELTGNGSIKFPGTQGASSDANSLDDYEEGTYTITASMSSGSITFVSSKNEAHYVKIGRKVFVSGEVGVSSVSSPSGTLFLNLPFTVGDFTDLSERFIGPFSIQNCNFDDAVNSLHISSYASQNTASIQMTTDNSGWSYLNANTITTSTEFSFSFCYSV